MIVEFIVRCVSEGYCTELIKDGQVMDRTALASEQDVVAWVDAYQDLVDQNLYVRLQSDGEWPLPELLTLATTLAGLGVTVGLRLNSSVCRIPAEQLQ